MKMKMIIFSFIIPIYNVETSLPCCVDSILALKVNSYEIILINDGSTDNSGKICDEYAKKDSRIKVIHKVNTGAAASRNVALEIAQGQYILFCDADDYYDSSILNNILFLLPCVPDEEILYCFNFSNVWSDGYIEKGPYLDSETVFSSFSRIVDFLSSEDSHKTMGYAVWNKLYCKSVIDKYKIRMPERNPLEHKDDWAEDLVFNILYCQYIKKIKVFNDVAYISTMRVTYEQQNENEKELVGRTEHMMGLFDYIYNSCSFKSNYELSADFWKIVIWQMKRYFYLDINEIGIKQLRNNCVGSKYINLLFDCIRLALDNWGDYSVRWNYIQGKEYKYILQYIINGNHFFYKLKNYFLSRTHKT